MIDFPAARLNTVSYILAEEMGHRNLNPVHRLDKLTSGVLIFAKVGNLHNFTNTLLNLVIKWKAGHGYKFHQLLPGIPTEPLERVFGLGRWRFSRHASGRDIM